MRLAILEKLLTEALDRHSTVRSHTMHRDLDERAVRFRDRLVKAVEVAKFCHEVKMTASCGTTPRQHFT
jgi:hypothetical protein